MVDEFDDIEGLFDEITPEQVIGSSAYRIRLRTYEHDDVESFREFLWECIEQTVRAGPRRGLRPRAGRHHPG
jgi:hypothetical protein